MTLLLICFLTSIYFIGTFMMYQVLTELIAKERVEQIEEALERFDAPQAACLREAYIKKIVFRGSLYEDIFLATILFWPILFFIKVIQFIVSIPQYLMKIPLGWSKNKEEAIKSQMLLLTDPVEYRRQINKREQQ